MGGTSCLTPVHGLDTAIPYPIPDALHRHLLRHDLNSFFSSLPNTVFPDYFQRPPTHMLPSSLLQSALDLPNRGLFLVMARTENKETPFCTQWLPHFVWVQIWFAASETGSARPGPCNKEPEAVLPACLVFAHSDQGRPIWCPMSPEVFLDESNTSFQDGTIPVAFGLNPDKRLQISVSYPAPYELSGLTLRQVLTSCTSMDKIAATSAKVQQHDYPKNPWGNMMTSTYIPHESAPVNYCLSPLSMVSGVESRKHSLFPFCAPFTHDDVLLSSPTPAPQPESHLLSCPDGLITPRSLSNISTVSPPPLHDDESGEITQEMVQTQGRMLSGSVLLSQLSGKFTHRRQHEDDTATPLWRPFDDNGLSSAGQFDEVKSALERIQNRTWTTAEVLLIFEQFRTRIQERERRVVKAHYEKEMQQLKEHYERKMTQAGRRNTRRPDPWSTSSGQAQHYGAATQ